MQVQLFHKYTIAVLFNTIGDKLRLQYNCGLLATYWIKEFHTKCCQSKVVTCDITNFVPKIESNNIIVTV